MRLYLRRRHRPLPPGKTEGGGAPHDVRRRAKCRLPLKRLWYSPADVFLLEQLVISRAAADSPGVSRATLFHICFMSVERRRAVLHRGYSARGGVVGPVDTSSAVTVDKRRYVTGHVIDISFADSSRAFVCVSLTGLQRGRFCSAALDRRSCD